MTRRSACAAIIAVSLIAGSQLAIRYAVDAVARSAALESRLFQPELRPGDRLNATAVAQVATGSIR